MNISPIYEFGWQSFECSFAISKSLSVKTAKNTDADRVKKINPTNMLYVTNIILDQSSDNSNAVFAFNLFGAVNSNYTLSIPVPDNSADMASLFRVKLLDVAVNIFGLTITDPEIVCDNFGYSPLIRSFSTPSLAVNTSRQSSTTRDTMVNASVDITSTISLTTGQTGKVSLQYADNTGFSTNVVTVQSATNGNTGSLTIGLNLSQVYTAALTGIVPAGKYYRLVTTNVTGTPTYGTPVIQEVLL